MSRSEAETSYRDMVRRRVKSGKLSSDDYHALKIYRKTLRLLPAEARAIEQEVLGAPTAPAISPAAGSAQSSAMNSSRQSSGGSPVVKPANSLDTELPDPAGTELSGTELPDTVLSGSSPAAPTVLPPKHSENYFIHLQQYGQEFLAALQAEGFNLGEETRERLRKLAKQYELDGIDIAKTERELLVDRFLTSRPPAKPADSSVTAENVEPVKYDAELRDSFEELEGSLKSGDFRTADEVTFEILLKVLKPPQPWFDEESLKKILAAPDKQAIEKIDQLWHQYSKGKFGFGRQMQLYGSVALDQPRGEHRRQALTFSKTVKWWISGFEFLKLYDWLDFTTEAPKAHLPALWFWKLSREQALRYGNLGLLAERGGCHVDPFILPAFMQMLKNCNIKIR